MGKVAVLGLGPSLSLFNPAEFEMSIGVNDIWSRVKSDVVVCIDHKTKFTASRLRVIESSRPKAFYSQIINWDTQPGFTLFKIAKKYPDRRCNLDTPEINKSLCSPYVACGIAYKYYNATEIHLFGVDLIGHSHFRLNHLTRMKLHFKNLKFALTDKGCGFIVHGEGYLKSL